MEKSAFSKSGSGSPPLEGEGASSAPAENPVPAIAVFDFDHTLIETDSFWYFLACIAGWPRTIGAFLESLGILLVRWARNRHDPVFRDTRTFVKDYLLRRILAGKKKSHLSSAVEKLRQRLRWKDPVRRALMEHHAKGHRIVIASGGLDIYLRELLKDMPHHDLICTRIEVRDDTLTGAMLSGNCVRLRKAELVAEYIAAHGPFAESWGYGNLPHDQPMLDLVKHRIVI